jgi:hypothetical protein
VPDEYRDYRLLKLGLSWRDIQDAPGVWLDWMLAIDQTVGEVVSRDY